MGRVFLTVLLAAGLCAGTAWYFELLPEMPWENPTHAGPVPPGTQKKKIDLGGPLYAPERVPPILQQPRPIKGDPIIAYATFVSRDQTDLASQVEGQILYVGEDIPEWMPGVAGVASFMVEPLQFAVIKLSKDDEVVHFYRRLREFDLIRHDQVVAMLDPTASLTEVMKMESRVLIAKTEAEAADKTLGEAHTRLIIAGNLKRGNSISAEDYRLADLTYEKSRLERDAKILGIRTAEVEANQARLKLRFHEVRNKLIGEHGRIKKILRQTGDSVKNLEPFLQVYGVDPLEAEALVEVQFADQLKLHQKILIEPTQEIPHEKIWQGHTLEVNSVAVSKDPKNPLILSGSEDKTVCVWSPLYPSPVAVLRHPSPVRTVLCSPLDASHNYCLAGCADGSIHVWNLANGKFTREKVLVAHPDSGVTCLAFSPRGKFFASGGADSKILLWETEPDKGAKFSQRSYLFETANNDTPHEGTITALTFLPQAKLVSAGRDNTLRVWELHEHGARLAYDPLEDRSGQVASLGVSRDGRWMLFDQARTLQMRSVETGNPVNALQNPGGAIPFESLAVFSPDASLLLTAGAPEGRLQLWKAPTENARGFEVRQLTTVQRQPVTCAVFSPYAGQFPEANFAVSGTKDGNVYLWALPTQADINQHRIENGQLSVIAQAQEIGRQATLRIQVPNPDGRLKPGRPVTIVIEP